MLYYKLYIRTNTLIMTLFRLIVYVVKYINGKLRPTSLMNYGWEKRLKLTCYELTLEVLNE